MKITLVLTVLLVLVACKKDDVRPDCETNQYGWLTIETDTLPTPPPAIWIDGEYKGQMDASSIDTFQISTLEKTHVLFYKRAINDTGRYVFDLKHCKTQGFHFGG